MSASNSAGPGGTMSGTVSFSSTKAVTVSSSAGTLSATRTLQPTGSSTVTSTVSESRQPLSLLEAGHTLPFSPFFQNLDFQSKRVAMRRPPAVAHLPLSRRFRVLFSDDVAIQVYRTAALFDYVDYGEGRRCRADDFDARWGAFDTAFCRQPLTCLQTRVPQRDPYTFTLAFGPASRAATCAGDSLMAEANVVIRGRFAPGPVYYRDVQLRRLADGVPSGARSSTTVLLRNSTDTVAGVPVRLSHTTRFWEESPGLTPGGTQLCEIDDVLAFNGHGGVGNGDTYACQWTDPSGGAQRACRTTAEYQTTCTNDLDCVGFSVGLNSLAFAVKPPYVVTEEPLFLHRGDESYTPDANITRFKFGPAIQGHVFYAKPGRVNRTCTYRVKQQPQRVTVMLAQTSFRDSFAHVYYVNTLGQRQLAAECGGRLPFAPRDSTGRPFFGENDRCDEFVVCAVSQPLPVNSTVEVVAGPLLDQRGCGSAVRALIQSTAVSTGSGASGAAAVRFFPSTVRRSVALPLVSTTASIARATVILREATTLQLDVLQTAFLGAHPTPAVSAALNPRHFYVRVNTSHPEAPSTPEGASVTSSLNTTVVPAAYLFGLSEETIAALPSAASALECGGSKPFGGGFAGLGGQCEVTYGCRVRPVEMSQAALAALAPALTSAQRTFLAALELPGTVTADTIVDGPATVFYSGPVVISADISFMRKGIPPFSLPGSCVRFQASIAATPLPPDGLRQAFSNTTLGLPVFPLAEFQPLVAVPVGATFTPTSSDGQRDTLVLTRFGPDVKDMHYENVSIDAAFARAAAVSLLHTPSVIDGSSTNRSFMCVRDATTGSTDICRVAVPLGSNHVTVRVAQIDTASNEVAVRFLPSPGAGASRTVRCGGAHGFQSVAAEAGKCGRYLTCVATFIDSNTTGVLEIEVPFGHVAPITTASLPPSGEVLGEQCAFAFAVSVDFTARSLPSPAITTREECHQRRQGLFCEDERMCLPLAHVCDGRGNDCASGRDEETCAHFLLVKRNTTLQVDQAPVLRTIDAAPNAMDCRRHAVVWSAEGFVYRSHTQQCALYGRDAVDLTKQSPDALMAPQELSDLYLLLEGGAFSFRKCTAELHCSGFGRLLNPDAPLGDKCLCECNSDRVGSDCSQHRTIGAAVSMYALVGAGASIVPAVLADALALQMRAVSVIIIGTSLFNASVAAVQFAPSSADAVAMARHQGLMWSTAGGPGPALTQINAALTALWQPPVLGLFHSDGHHSFGAFAQCGAARRSLDAFVLNCSASKPREAQQLLVRTQGVPEFSVTVALTARGPSLPERATRTAVCSVRGGTAALDGVGDCATTSCIVSDAAVSGYDAAVVTIHASGVSSCGAASAMVLATSGATFVSLSAGSSDIGLTSPPASSERTFGALAAVGPAKYIASPQDFVVTDVLDSGLFSATVGVGALMALTLVAIAAVVVLMTRAFRSARVVIRGTNAIAMRYLPAWVKVTLINERLNTSPARVMLYAFLGIATGALIVGTLTGLFSVMYVKSTTSSVGVAVAIDVYATTQCGGSGGRGAFMTTFPTRATSFSAVGTCSALAFTGRSEDTIIGKGMCFSDGRILLALSRTPTGCQSAALLEVQRGQCVPLKSLGFGGNDTSVAYAVVDCVSTALARDHVAGLHAVNPSGALDTTVAPSSPEEIATIVDRTAADGSTVHVRPYRTGRVPGLATSHDTNTISSVHSAAYIAGAPDTDRLVLQTADSFLPVSLQTQNSQKGPSAADPLPDPLISGSSSASEQSFEQSLADVTVSSPMAQSRASAAAMSLTAQHAVRIGTPLLAVVANGGASNATVRAISAATAVDPSGVAPAIDDLPLGDLFSGSSLMTPAGAAAQRYFHVDGTDFDVGATARKNAADGAITLQAWVRATETTRGVAVGIVDHLENTVTKSSPVIEQMLLAVAAGDAASALWFSSTWRVYSALVLDGPARQISYVFAEPNETQRVVLAQWQLDELGKEEFFISREWHHVAVVVSRGLGKPFVRLYIDGHTILNSQLWRKCLPRDPPAVAPLPSVVHITGAIETQQAVATHGGAVYVGYGNMGVGAVSVRGQASDAGYFTRRGTRAMRVRNAMRSPSLLVLAAASVVGAIVCFAAVALSVRTIRVQAHRLRTARRIDARQTFDGNKERLFSKRFLPLSYAATRELLDLQDGDEFTLFMKDLVDEPTDTEGSSKLVHCLWLASGGDGPCTPELWADRVVRHADDVMLRLGKAEIVGGEITLDDDAAAAEASLGAGSGAAVELPPQLSAVFLAVLTTLQSLGTYMVSWDLPPTFGWVKSVVRLFSFDWLLNIADSPLTAPIVFLFVTLVTLALLAFILARDVQRFRSHLLRYQFVRDRAEGVATGLRDRALGVLLSAVDASFFRPDAPKPTPKLHTTKDPYDGCRLDALRCPLHSDRVLIPREQDKVFPFHGRYRCCVVAHKKRTGDTADVAASLEVSASADCDRVLAMSRQSESLSPLRPAPSHELNHAFPAAPVLEAPRCGDTPPLPMQTLRGSGDDQAAPPHGRARRRSVFLPEITERLKASVAQHRALGSQSSFNSGARSSVFSTNSTAGPTADDDSPDDAPADTPAVVPVRQSSPPSGRPPPPARPVKSVVKREDPSTSEEKLVRCGDDQCLLLTCPECNYAVCEAHARAPTYRRILNDLWMLGRAYILHGWVWFAEFIVLNVAIAIYTPVLTTCVMIIGCHPQFQCVFPHCWRKVEQDYAAAVYLAAVVGVVFGLGFPLTLYVLIQGRIGVLMDVFASAPYGGAFMAPIDKITPVVKSDEAELNFSVTAGPSVPLQDVGAPVACVSINLHVPDVEETVSHDPMDHSNRSRSGRSGPSSRSLSPQLSAADAHLRLTHSGLSARLSRRSQLRSSSRLLSRQSTAAALDQYTSTMPDPLRREVRKTGGIHGMHYHRTAAHWARDIVVRPTVAWAMWQQGIHGAANGRWPIQGGRRGNGSVIANSLSDLGGSFPGPLSRQRSARRTPQAAKYLSPDRRRTSTQHTSLDVTSPERSGDGDSKDLKLSFVSVGTPLCPRASFPLPVPRSLPQQISSRRLSLSDDGAATTLRSMSTQAVEATTNGSAGPDVSESETRHAPEALMEESGHGSCLENFRFGDQNDDQSCNGESGAVSLCSKAPSDTHSATLSNGSRTLAVQSRTQTADCAPSSEPGLSVASAAAESAEQRPTDQDCRRSGAPASRTSSSTPQALLSLLLAPWKTSQRKAAPLKPQLSERSLQPACPVVPASAPDTPLTAHESSATHTATSNAPSSLCHCSPAKLWLSEAMILPSPCETSRDSSASFSAPAESPRAPPAMPDGPSPMESTGSKVAPVEVSSVSEALCVPSTNTESYTEAQVRSPPALRPLAARRVRSGLEGPASAPLARRWEEHPTRSEVDRVSAPESVVTPPRATSYQSAPAFPSTPPLSISRSHRRTASRSAELLSGESGAPRAFIVGDVVSLTLSEQAQLRAQRRAAPFATPWLEALHSNSSADTRREMAARRLQELWRRDLPGLSLQRVVVQAIVEFKAAVVLQRLFKSMLQRKFVAAVKRQAAMAHSYDILTSEWLRFAKCDASILALVYQQLRFDRITTVPALLCGKFLFVIPTLLLEPQSVGQFAAMCLGEMIYAALFVSFDPYLSPWVTVITLLGSAQQLLFIAAQISVVAVRNDLDIAQPAGYTMAGLMFCYFSSIAGLLAYMIIMPALRSNTVKRAVAGVFERFGLLRPDAEETFRHKHPQGFKDIPGLEVDLRQQSHHWAIVPPKAAEDATVDGLEITTSDAA